MTDGHILTMSCPDRPGIVHAVSGCLLELGGNILEAAQYDGRDTGLFFMRVHFAAPAADFASAFAPVAERFAIRFHFADAARPMPTLTAIGRDVESAVLARALKWHAEHRIISNGSKTVVFR